MKRISDEYLALYLEQLESLRKSNPGEWMYQEPWRLALEEIRDRRAADLAGWQVTWIRAFVEAGRVECAARMGIIPPIAQDALAALSKLIDGGRP